MKKSIKDFQQYAINNDQMQNQKGGIFCELYAGYVESQNLTMNPSIMAVAEDLDQTLYTQGWFAAIRKGAGYFMNTYS